MNPADYAIHDIQIAHQQTPTTSGAWVNTVRVQFFVGSHGPFVKTYNEADATTDRIKSDITAQQQQLQSIGELAG